MLDLIYIYIYIYIYIERERERERERDVCFNLNLITHVTDLFILNLIVNIKFIFY